MNEASARNLINVLATHATRMNQWALAYHDHGQHNAGHEYMRISINAANVMQNKIREFVDAGVLDPEAAFRITHGQPLNHIRREVREEYARIYGVKP